MVWPACNSGAACTVCVSAATQAVVGTWRERECVCVWPIKLHLASSSKKTDKDGFSLGHENKQAVKKMDKLHSASSSKNTQTRFVSAQSSKYNHKGASEKKRCFGKKKSDRSRRARWSSCMSRTGLRGKSSVGPK